MEEIIQSRASGNAESRMKVSSLGSGMDTGTIMSDGVHKKGRKPGKE